MSDRKMPTNTRRAHYKPSWRGDSVRAIRRLGRRSGEPKIDVNFQWIWEDPRDHTLGGKARAMHWTKPFRNNYHFILEPESRRARPMTRAERNRPVGAWRDADVRRWRRTWRATSAHPPTYQTCVNAAVRAGVVITAELKSPAFGTDAAAQYLVNAARHAGHPPWFMALINMKNCRGKCEAIERNGGQFAVIFGRFRSLARKPPPDWAAWNPKPTRLWGPAKWSLS